MAQQKTLVSADGKREWTPEDAVQETNLRAQGWTEKPAGKAAAPRASTSN